MRRRRWRGVGSVSVAAAAAADVIWIRSLYIDNVLQLFGTLALLYYSLGLCRGLLLTKDQYGLSAGPITTGSFN